MLAPKPARAFLTARGPIRHGSVKLPGSPFFGKLLWMIAEHSSLSLTGEAAFSSFSLWDSRLREAVHPRHPFSASLTWREKANWMTWKVGKIWMAEGQVLGANPDLVVMAKVGASGLGVSLFLIMERIWENCSCNSLRYRRSDRTSEGKDHRRCLPQTSIPAPPESLKLTEAIFDLESLIESGSEPQTPLPALKNLHGASPSNDINLPRTLSKRGGALVESSQSSESSIGVRCNTCGSIVHSTTDHNDFDHFKRGSPSGTSTVDAQGVYLVLLRDIVQ
ncbi:hypothetical protein Tco_1284681 [Tanacetum coccineum]